MDSNCLIGRAIAEVIRYKVMGELNPKSCPQTATMPNYRECPDSNNRGQEDHSQKHRRSPHSPEHRQDDPCQRRTCSPSSHHTGTRAQSAQSFTVDTQLDAAAIFTWVLPEWEIEENMHVPIHMKNCQLCIDFAGHVVSQTQGGTLEILNSKQWCHWR